MKKRNLAAVTSIIGVALLLSPATTLKAAEIKVLAGGSMSDSLKELGPEFERASGHKLVIHFDSTPNLVKRATAGTPFDLAVAPVDLFKNADAKARFLPVPPVDIARVGFGVIGRAGAPKPDVSTPEALKKTLLNSQSVALVPESAAGAYIMKVFERLGIADAMKAKIKPQSTPAQIPQAVAKGDAELGMFLANVLIAPGVEMAGPFPAELQQELLFVAGVAAESKEAEAANSLIAYLRTPAARAVIKAKGMTPG